MSPAGPATSSLRPTSAADLLQVRAGPITEKGLRTNVNVSLRHLESWLRGTGCVPIFSLMENAATQRRVYRFSDAARLRVSAVSEAPPSGRGGSVRSARSEHR